MIFWWICGGESGLSILFLCHLGTALVVLFLLLWAILSLFSTMAVPTYIPTSSIQGFPFIHILPSVCYLCSFHDSHSNRCGWYLIVVLICISLMINDVEHLLMYLLAICVVFEEMYIYNFCSFLNWFVWYWVVGAVSIGWILTPYWSYHLKIFSKLSFC